MASEGSHSTDDDFPLVLESSEDSPLPTTAERIVDTVTSEIPGSPNGSTSINLVEMAARSTGQRSNQAPNGSNNPFDPEQIWAIELHIKYHVSYKKYLEDRLQGKQVNEPRKPKNRIDFLKPPKKATEELSADAVSSDLERWVQLESKEGIFSDDGHDVFMRMNSLEEILPLLKEGSAIIRTKTQNMLSCALFFGAWLHRARMFFKAEKQTITWQRYLEKDIDISYSYANKLIELSCFCEYPPFHALAISINDLYNKRKIIQKHICENQKFRDRWTTKQRDDRLFPDPTIE